MCGFRPPVRVFSAGWSRIYGAMTLHSRRMAASSSPVVALRISCTPLYTGRPASVAHPTDCLGTKTAPGSATHWAICMDVTLSRWQASLGEISNRRPSTSPQACDGQFIDGSTLEETLLGQMKFLIGFVWASQQDASPNAGF